MIEYQVNIDKSYLDFIRMSTANTDCTYSGITGISYLIVKS